MEQLTKIVEDRIQKEYPRKLANIQIEHALLKDTLMEQVVISISQTTFERLCEMCNASEEERKYYEMRRFLQLQV